MIIADCTWRVDVCRLEIAISKGIISSKCIVLHDIVRRNTPVLISVIDDMTEKEKCIHYTSTAKAL